MCWKRSPEREHHEHQLGGFGRLWEALGPCAGSEPPNASIMSISWQALGGFGPVCWKRSPEREHHEHQLGGFGRLWEALGPCAGREPPNTSIMSMAGFGRLWARVLEANPRTRAS